MTRRINRLVAVVTALAALALGGAVFAQAKTHHAVKHERVSAVDTDNIQSGDQTTPDVSAKQERVSAVDTDNIQSGDQTSPDVTAKSRHHARNASTAAGQSGSQTTPDTGASSETTGETAGETPGSESASDGPGGHADPAGANVDHQFVGVE